MNCPVCHDPMIVLEHEQVEIDHCLSCKGIWLDSGELKLLLEGSGEGGEILSSFKAERDSKEKVRKCPICSKEMEKVSCGDGSKVQIDRCRRNDGLWFDLGELQEIIKMGSFGRSSKVLDWLKNLFGQGLEQQRRRL